VTRLLPEEPVALPYRLLTRIQLRRCPSPTTLEQLLQVAAAVVAHKTTVKLKVAAVVARAVVLAG
jgi:hypothetical protein